MSLNEHSSYGSLLYTTDKVSQTASAIAIEHLITLDTALAEMTDVSVTRFICSQSVIKVRRLSL